MSRRALIADPDENEARKQAAILTDEGYDADICADDELFEQLSAQSPDILILRHERPGQNGLALCVRIRRENIAPGTAIVVTTSELAPEAIDKHRSQPNHADGYIRLPLSRKDLLEAARAVPEVVEADDVGAATDPEQELPEAPEAPASPYQHVPHSAADSVDLSADDLQFVEDVFSSIQHIDPEKPALPVGQQALEGPDRKIALLRKNLRERERELARLSRLWRTREERFREAERRFQEKDIEIEGLNLRIRELNASLDAAQAELEGKIAEFGVIIGDQFEEKELAKAELIHEVAIKESELNKVKRKLRDLTADKEKTEKELTDRVFEWERAYQDFQAHHWQVVEASYDEVLRLESTVDARDVDRKALRQNVRGLEEQLVRTQLKLTGLERQRLADAHARFEEWMRTSVNGDLLYLTEQRRRVASEDREREQDARLYDVEDNLWRHHRLLRFQERQKRKAVAPLVQQISRQQDELHRLEVELRHASKDNTQLAMTLDKERAFGEAAIHHLLSVSDTERQVTRLQTAHRDKTLDDLNEDAFRTEARLKELAERLANEEVEHTAERARADELEHLLAATQDRLSETESGLKGDIATLTGERDTLRQRLDRVEASFDETLTALEVERRERTHETEQYGIEIERREVELKERQTRLQEFDRDLAGARGDIDNLRATVHARDERVSELLAKVREADEQIVVLESQTSRLTTTVAERDAELGAKGDEIATLGNKISQRDDRVAAMMAEVEQSQGRIRELEQALMVSQERAGQMEIQVQNQGQGLEASRLELQNATREIEQLRHQRSVLEADLQSSRAEVDTGQTVLEELQGRLTGAEQRLDGLRATMNARAQELSESQEALANMQRELSERDAALDAKAGEYAHLEQSLRMSQQEKEELNLKIEHYEQALNVLEGEKMAAIENARDQSRALEMVNEQMTDGRLAQDELKEELIKVRTERDNLQTQFDSLRGRAKTLDDERRQMAETLLEKEKALTALSTGRDAVDARLSEMSSQIQEAEDAQRALQEQLADQSSETGQMAAMLDDRTAQVEQLKRNMTLLRQQNLDKDTALKEANEALNDAKSGAEEIGELAEAKNSELEELRSTIEEQQLAIDERKKWLATRESRIRELESELQSVREGTNSASEELEARDGRIAELSAKLEKAERSLAENEGQGAKRVEVLQRKFREAQEEAQRLQEELDQAHQSVGETAEAAQQSSQLQAALKDAERRTRDAEQRFTELKANREAIVKKLKDEHGARKKTQALFERSQDRLARLENEMSRLQSKASAGEQDRSQANADLEGAQVDAQQAKREAAILREQVQSLQQGINESRQQLVAVESKHAQDLLQAESRQSEEARRLTDALQASQRAQRDAMQEVEQVKAERDRIRTVAQNKIREMAAAQRHGQSVPPTTHASTPPLPPVGHSDEEPATQVMQRPPSGAPETPFSQKSTAIHDLDGGN